MCHLGLKRGELGDHKAGKKREKRRLQSLPLFSNYCSEESEYDSGDKSRHDIRGNRCNERDHPNTLEEVSFSWIS